MRAHTHTHTALTLGLPNYAILYTHAHTHTHTEGGTERELSSKSAGTGCYREASTYTHTHFLSPGPPNFSMLHTLIHVYSLIIGPSQYLIVARAHTHTALTPGLPNYAILHTHKHTERERELSSKSGGQAAIGKLQHTPTHTTYMYTYPAQCC